MHAQMTELEALKSFLTEPAKSGIAATRTMDEAFAILQNTYGFTQERCKLFGDEAKRIANDTGSAKL